MLKNDLIKLLENMHDFKTKKTKVEELISSHKHRCIFLPKYYCELNPIERVWDQAEHYTRSNCEYTFGALEKIINQPWIQLELS